MSLKKRTLIGFFWTSAGTLGNGIVSMIVTMILSRLLTPHDFALIALLNIFLAVSNVIVDSGFSQAVIRDDNPSQEDLSSVFYFNILLAIAVYIVLYFFAPKISVFYNAPELTILSRTVFLVIIFNASSLIQNSTLNRDLNFEVLNKVSVLGSILAGFIAIIMALTGFGIWALVANSVLMPFFRSVLLWYHSTWRPSKNISFLSIKKYLNFGFFLMVQGVIDGITTNIISLIIGKVYTKDDLGYYSQGNKLDGYIITPFNSIIQKVTYPILSKIKDDKARLKEAYREIIGTVMFVFTPIIFFTIAAHESIIVTLFGSQWFEAGIYLKIGAYGAILFPLQRVCGNIILLKGRTRAMLNVTLFKQVLRLTLIFTFINRGVIALAVVFSISDFIGSILYIILGMYYLKYTFLELLNDLYKVIIASSLSIVAVKFVSYIIGDLKIPILLAILGVVMLLSYLASSMLLKNNKLNELLKLFNLLFVKLKTRNY